MEIQKGVFRIMWESGLVASNSGHFDDADTIFRGLNAIRPENEYPLIGLAANQMNMGKYTNAVDILKEQAFKINPENDLAKAYLALNYKVMKRVDDLEAVCNEIIEQDGADEAVVEMAKILLEAIDEWFLDK